MFDYKEQCQQLTRNILALSDLLRVYTEDDVIFSLPVMVHMPIPNDIGKT